jgi:hypothetical protein
MPIRNVLILEAAAKVAKELSGTLRLWASWPRQEIKIMGVFFAVRDRQHGPLIRIIRLILHNSVIFPPTSAHAEFN